MEDDIGGRDMISDKYQRESSSEIDILMQGRGRWGWGWAQEMKAGNGGQLMEEGRDMIGVSER